MRVAVWTPLLLKGLCHHKGGQCMSCEAMNLYKAKMQQFLGCRDMSYTGVKLCSVLVQVSLSCARPLTVAVPHRLGAQNKRACGAAKG